MLSFVDILKEPIRSRSQVLIGRQLVRLRPRTAKQLRERFLALRHRQRIEPMNQFLHSLSHDLRLPQNGSESSLLLFPRPNHSSKQTAATSPQLIARREPS